MKRILWERTFTMETVEIRKRKIEDSSALAHCIATVWNATYKGIVDDEFLENLRNSEIENAERLKNSIETQPHYYVLTINKKIIGWIYFTLETEGYENTAEIHSLYVLPEYQKKGYGKQLYRYAIEKIVGQGIQKLIIGCLDGNPSNEFYKHLGGKYIGNRLFREKYLENVYLFEL